MDMINVNISLHDACIEKIECLKNILQINLDGVFLAKEHPQNPLHHLAYAYPATILIENGSILKATLQNTVIPNMIEKINHEGWRFEILDTIRDGNTMQFIGIWWSDSLKDGHLYGKIILCVLGEIKVTWEQCVLEG